MDNPGFRTSDSTELMAEMQALYNSSIQFLNVAKQVPYQVDSQLDSGAGSWIGASSEFEVTRTHTQTHADTGAGNNDTRRPKLALGKNRITNVLMTV